MDAMKTEYRITSDEDPDSHYGTSPGFGSVWKQMRIQDPDPYQNQCESKSLRITANLLN